ncbi:MAG TPA: hypothetical protein VF765_19530 [Polyangiaceae bacterium]
MLAAAKLALGAWVLHAGFTHVSDDDYARTVIAQQFAHAPRLDPSGTSWLPAPFWIEGLAMMVLGRTLAAARAVAMILGAASVAAPYLAMRAAGMKRAAAIAATAVAMTLPWSMWLGVATVPEGWANALVAAGVIAMAVEGARPWAAAALLVASLSRYEAWPACAVMAAFCAWGAAAAWPREGRRTAVACALAAVAGPVAWMLWNAHAHGSALHFVARVTNFRRAIGAADVPVVDKLLDYPRALVTEAPVAALLGLTGCAGLLRPELRRRWGLPALTAAVVLAFLVWGDVRDGAPTHHPARALVAVWWILVAMGADTLATLFALHRRALAYAVGGLLTVATVATLLLNASAPPGTSDADAREPQIARGFDLRARHVLHADVTPCAFEHFAMLAAWGAPERANVAPRTGAPVTADCPAVVER